MCYNLCRHVDFSLDFSMEALEKYSQEELATLGEIVLQMGPRDNHQQDARGWNRFYMYAITKFKETLK